MSDEPLPLAGMETTNRQHALIENWHRLNEAINLVTSLNHSSDNALFGITLKEKTYHIQWLTAVLDRVNAGLAEEIPKPANDDNEDDQ